MLNRMEPYLTIDEVAGLLKVKPKTIRNKIAAGVFKKGVHYFRPKGFGTRFKWSTIVALIENTENAAPEDDRIPMKRGYFLGGPRKKNIAA